MSNYILTANGELYHAGIKGMKWGLRRYQNTDGSLTPAGKKRYNSTSLRSAIARRQNEKVDKGFDKWKDGAKKRDDAIALGKKANEARLAYETNKGDKNLKSAYQQANKEYKKALSKNTTYRKGTVRQEVGKDMSRKYLSEAKKVKKQLYKNPGDKALQKKYNNLMSQHDIERAAARKAQSVGAKRSMKKASIKRTMTMTVKSVAATAAIAGGVYAVNRALQSRNVTVNGKRVQINRAKVSQVADFAKKVKNAMGFVY